MNARIDTERILDAYLAPEADRLHDRVMDAALASYYGDRSGAFWENPALWPGRRASRA